MSTVKYLLLVIATAWFATPSTQAVSQHQYDTTHYQSSFSGHVSKWQKILEGCWDTFKPVFFIAAIYCCYKTIQYLIEDSFLSANSDSKTIKKQRSLPYSKISLLNPADENQSEQQHT